jgi:peptidoglycan/LPS O-acetylase OafA/YrhL
MIKSPDRFFALDATRGFAAIGIVFFHSAFSPHTFWSLVDYFFVLSGFVLYPYFYDNNKKNKLRFLGRRFLYFSKLSLTSISVAFIVYGVQLLMEELTQNFGDRPAEAPGNVLLIPPAILLLQIFSKNLQLLNPPLWSLSAEIFANFIGGLISFRKIKQVFCLYLALFFIFIYEYNRSDGQNEGVVGWMALYRVLMGFYVGLITRQLFESRIRRDLKWETTAPLIVVLFCLSQAIIVFLDKLSLLVIPFIFGLIVILIAQTLEPKNETYRAICRNFGKYSVGIYIFQSPVEPIAAFLADTILFPGTVNSLYLAIYSILKVILCVCATIFIDYFTKRCSKIFNGFSRNT